MSKKQKNKLNKLNKLNEKELLILRKAVEECRKKKVANLLALLLFKEIINIIEQFLKDNAFICYGGTAINNILTYSYDQFYDKNTEIPDYDFFYS